MLGDLARVAPGMGPIGRTREARPGPWQLFVVESADIDDDRLARAPGELRSINVLQNTWTERQLLKPFDILVTARARRVKAALIPPGTSRTVAAATLLVVRVHEPAPGLAHYLWYFLTSARGRALVEEQVRQGVTLPTLSARALASVPVPVPTDAQLRAFPALVDATAQAHETAIAAARVRRDLTRDAIIAHIAAESREGVSWH